MACASGILMASLTIAVVLVEIYRSEFRLMREHLFLGGIISILFFTMCNYGLEIVNWIFIGIIPTYILITWLASFIKFPLNASCSIPNELPSNDTCTTVYNTGCLYNTSDS